MTGQHGGARVIATDDDHVGAERANLGNERVEALERRHLRVEVAVLAGFVGVLVMDEEVVVTVPVLAERGHLVGESGAGLEHFHPDELGKTAIHRVRRDGRGAQRSEEHTSELQSLRHLVCRLLLEKKKKKKITDK